MVFTRGKKDGILVWKFNGDITTNYLPQDDEEILQAKPLAEPKAQPTVLE
jgi:hypothetical protein